MTQQTAACGAVIPDTAAVPLEAEPEQCIPLIEETLSVGKRRVATGGVRIQIRVEEREAPVEIDLERTEIELRRVPVGRPVDAIPETRREGGKLIIPVVEEEVVITKRLVLREEIHLIPRAMTVTERTSVTLRSEKAVVTRAESKGARPA